MLLVKNEAKKFFHPSITAVNLNVHFSMNAIGMNFRTNCYLHEHLCGMFGELDSFILPLYTLLLYLIIGLPSQLDISTMSKKTF